MADELQSIGHGSLDWKRYCSILFSQIGILTITRSPPIGEAASATSPPWLRATSRAMVSPRPTPPVSTLRDSSRRQNRRNPASYSFGGIRAPSHSPPLPTHFRPHP